ESSGTEDSIPPRILWLNQHLPWSQFIFAETVVVAAITVLVVVGTLVAQAVLGFYAPPCNTQACDDAMGLARRTARLRLPPCNGFHEHLCGPGVADRSKVFHLQHIASNSLLERATAAGSDAGQQPKGAMEKAATFYATCHRLFLPPSEASSFRHDVSNVLTILKTHWQGIVQLSSNDLSTLEFMLRLVVKHRIELGFQIRLYDGNLHIKSANSLRNQLDLPPRHLEAMLGVALNASGATVHPSQLTEFLLIDESLTNLSDDDDELAVALPPQQFFQKIYPKERETWLKALTDTPQLVDSLEPTKLVRVRDISFLQIFTNFVFKTASKTKRSLWLLFHALLPALKAEVVRGMQADAVTQVVESFCYRQCQGSQYGVALDSFLWTSILGSHGGRSAVPIIVDLLRSQAALVAARLFSGGLLHEVLQQIEDVEVTRLLGPNSPEEVKQLELLYKDLPMPSQSDYYVNRLMPTMALQDDTKLAEQHSRCLEDDVQDMSVAGRRRLCVLPAGVSHPLFYSGAEPFVNFPTLGFLLAEPYTNVLFDALRRAPPGTEPSRRFAATLACLHRQLESLTNATLAGDAKPVALFRHAGALQLAHDAVENSGGFGGGDLERRAFFERHCWMWCSRLLGASRTSTAPRLDARTVCSIAVRNVLAFYRAFRCYPEDYMGNVEVCAVLGVPPYKQ
ncbi:hypothetical protein V5799_013367, partial [Amblyomma americanum]